MSLETVVKNRGGWYFVGGVFAGSLLTVFGTEVAASSGPYLRVDSPEAVELRCREEFPDDPVGFGQCFKEAAKARMKQICEEYNRLLVENGQEPIDCPK